MHLTRILLVISALILALAIGVACEGQEVTREDVEEALEEALGPDLDVKSVEQAVRNALDDDEVPVGSSTSCTMLRLAAPRSRRRRFWTAAQRSTLGMRMVAPHFLAQRLPTTTPPWFNCSSTLEPTLKPKTGPSATRLSTGQCNTAQPSSWKPCSLGVRTSRQPTSATAPPLERAYSTIRLTWSNYC